MMSEAEYCESIGDLAPHQVEFAIALVRDVPIESTANRICMVLECARRHKGDVLSFDASGLIITFDMQGDATNAAEARCAFARDLQNAAKTDVSLVHGSRHALVGTVGTEHRKSFTFLFEGYRDCLRELIALPLGHVKQV